MNVFLASTGLDKRSNPLRWDLNRHSFYRFFVQFSNFLVGFNLRNCNSSNKLFGVKYFCLLYFVFSLYQRYYEIWVHMMAVVYLIVILDWLWVQGNDDWRIFIQLAYFDHGLPSVDSCEDKYHHVIHVEMRHKLAVELDQLLLHHLIFTDEVKLVILGSNVNVDEHYWAPSFCLLGDFLACQNLVFSWNIQGPFLSRVQPRFLLLESRTESCYTLQSRVLFLFWLEIQKDFLYLLPVIVFLSDQILDDGIVFGREGICFHKYHFLRSIHP